MAQQINGFFAGDLSATQTFGGCIDIFKNVWPDPAQTIEMIEQQVQDTNSGLYWDRAETIDQGANQRQRTNDILYISELAERRDNSACQNIHNQFRMLLIAATSNYASKYGMHAPMYHEPYSLLKYEGGAEYKAHYDGTTDTGRCISALVYLNENYKGGEIEFPHFDLKIKPEAGMLILFPSNFAYTHIAHPVTEGTKYNLVTWIADRQI